MNATKSKTRNSFCCSGVCSCDGGGVLNIHQLKTTKKWGEIPRQNFNLFLCIFQRLAKSSNFFRLIFCSASARSWFWFDLDFFRGFDLSGVKRGPLEITSRIFLFFTHSCLIMLIKFFLYYRCFLNDGPCRRLFWNFFWFHILLNFWLKCKGKNSDLHDKTLKLKNHYSVNKYLFIWLQKIA